MKRAVVDTWDDEARRRAGAKYRAGRARVRAHADVETIEGLEHDPRFIVLTADEWRILGNNPYDGPSAPVCGTREVKIAQALIDRGLLERDPTASAMVVRVTDRGEKAATPLSCALARRAIVRLTELRSEDPEAAASFERALTASTLLLVATGDVPARDVAEIVLSINGGW